MDYNKLVEKFGSRVKETTIEILINNLSGVYYFPDNSLLLNRTVVGAYYYDGAGLSPITGRTLASKTVQASGFITLVAGNTNVLEYSPLTSFAATDEAPGHFKPLVLDGFVPTKSYLAVDPAAPPVSGTSLMLTFIYLD